LRRVPATLVAGTMLFGAALAPAGFIIAGSQLVARPAIADIVDAQTFTLKNGLQVVVLPNHRAPVVFQMIAYRVGAADGLPGKNGVAHFLEHLMFKATDKLQAGQFTKEIDRRGGTDNAFTNQDMTAFHQEIAKEHLPLIMSMEADRMTGLRLTDAVVMPERDVIIEERRERTDNEPGAQLQEMMNASLFLNHPYRLPVIGWLHEMQQYSTKDAVDFYHRFYAPNNAILVVAGDVTLDQVKHLAEQDFGSLPRHDVPPRQRLSEPQQTAPREVSLTSDLVRQSYMVKSFLAPSYRVGLDSQASKDNDAYALLLLSDILGEGTTSRLYRRLVINDKSATDAASSYDPSAYDLGSFTVYGSPVPGGDMKKVEAAIADEIALILKDGVTEDELRAAKQRLRIETIKARDSLSGPAVLIASALVNGRSLQDVQAWPDRVAAVTVADIQRAAHRVFEDKRSVTGRLLATGASQLNQAPGAKSVLPPAPATGVPGGSVQ
jgi:zinc protease